MSLACFPRRALIRLRVGLLAVALAPGLAGAASAPPNVGLGYGEIPLPPYPATLPDATAHVYRDFKPEPLRLHVFRPVGWKAGDRRPALIWFFGGGWAQGGPGFSVPFARWAASLGMVGIAPDYRVKERFGTPVATAVADGRAVLRWVEEHASELGIDASRIVVGGNSAGAHLALWTAIAHSPPGSDPREAPAIKPAALVLTSAASDTSRLSIARLGTADPLALSPVHQLDPRMPPLIEFHGREDKIVPLAIATALHDRLLATGNVAELVVIPDGGHNFVAGVPAWKERTLATIRDFLERQHLLPANGP